MSSWSWGRVRRWSVVATACAAVSSLVVVDGTAAAIEPARPPTAASPAAATVGRAVRVDSRPDAVSAGVSARAQGSRVEVGSARSEFSTTWANPDGTFTTEESAGRVRFKDASGQWRPVDLSLSSSAGADGSVPVASHPDGVVLGGAGLDESGRAAVAGESSVARAAAGAGRSVSLGWAGRLGKPVVVKDPQSADEWARWSQVRPGLDVLASPRRSGFEARLEVTSAAGVESGTSAGGRVSWSLPLKTRGLAAKVAADGGVDFTDAKGVVVSRIAPMTAWDAKKDTSGSPANVVPVSASVSQRGRGKATLTLSVDEKWAKDPGRVFPLTVDPTYASGQLAARYDAFVQTGFSSDQSDSAELRIGTYDGGSNIARTYMRFSNGVQGLQVVSANLSLYETYSYSCTGRGMYVYKSGNPDRSTSWTNQPAITTPAAGSVTAAKGYSASCPAGRVNIPVTPLVQGWSKDSATSVALSLRAGSEKDSLGWKKFASSETSTPPFISYTYNRKPNAASAPSVSKSAQYDGVTYVAYPDPVLSAVAADPDGNGVAMNFEVHTSTTATDATKVASCSTGVVASGGKASCTPTTALPDGKQLYVRAAVKDELGLWNGTWSPWTPIRTALSKPATPTISCTGYADGSWTSTAPASAVPCTVTVPAAAHPFNQPVRLFVTVDGRPRQSIDVSAGAGTYGGISVPVTAGGHTVQARTQSASTWTSEFATASFGWGEPSVDAPTAGTATNGTVAVRASGPPANGAAVTAKVRYRQAGDTSRAWTDSSVLSVSGSGSQLVSAAGSWDAAAAVSALGLGEQARTPVLLEMSVCFTYGASSTKCSTPITLTRLPHAFGSAYPTAQAGPGQVGLYTGEFATDATDVSVPGYAGELSISRSHASFTGDGTLTNWPADPVRGVFGPGWTASLDGPEAGFAGTQVIDSTHADGTIALVDGVDDPLVFRQPGAGRVQDQPGTYVPATDDTAAADVKLVLAGSGTSARLTLTQDDGTVTVFAPVAAPVAGKATAWKPVSVKEPGQSGTTTYGHDPATGRVTRIVAAVPAGIDPATCPTAGAMAKGCRALEITYATATTATAGAPGDVAGQVKSVAAVLWDPASSAMKTTTVATYSYDENKRLVKVSDPRTGLTTSYSWVGGSTRLASITPAGQAPFRISYDAVISGQPRVAQVTRDPATAGGSSSALASFVYGIDATQTGSGLPDLTAGTVARWAQKRAPVTGYAVFGADHPVGSTVASNVAAGDWPFADLQYVDAYGYTVNTASHGAGAWQVTAADYDEYGNVTRALDASAINTVNASAAAGKALSAGQVDELSTQTLYNSEVKNTDGTIVLPGGSRVETTTAPARPITLADGAGVRARPRTVNTYDAGAPNDGVNPATGQRYSLPTTVTEQIVDGSGAAIATTQVTTNTYTPVVAGDGDGWALGTPTKVTVASTVGATDGITRVTRFDTEGRTIETRQPLASGSDAGTTKTAYYTAGTNTADAACGNKPEWTGLTCRTWPAAAPNSGPTLPDERTTAYSMWLAPATTVETSGAATRTTTSTFDAAGRVVTSKTTANGLSGSMPRAGTFTKYDAATGLVAYTGDLNTAGTDATTNRVTYTRDAWGREVSRVTDQGVTVTTAYDSAGRVATVNDSKGVTTYGYDGTDAAGKSEHRGLVTSLKVTRGGSAGEATFTAAYDAEATMTLQAMPGQIRQRVEVDEVGQHVGLSYSGQVTPVTEAIDPNTGERVYTPGTAKADQPWLSWTLDRDHDGRIARESTGQGTATDGLPGVSDPAEVKAPATGRARGYTREYDYDVHGRLVKVADRTAAVTGADAATAACRVTGYVFDANGRRTSRTSGTYDSTCAGTGTGVASTSYAYDSADRATTGGNGSGSYVYDLFGRATTVPAADAPSPAKGALALGYFDDDLPASISQAGVTTTFTLTGGGRRKTQVTKNSAGAVTGTVERFYADDSDNPAWTVSDADGAGPAAAVTTRYAESIAGDLGAQLDPTGGLELTLANPRGDAVTSVEMPAGQGEATPATAITAWSDYTEYGAPTEPASAATVAGPAGYAFLGAKRRSTSDATAGLTLMGDRLYNPVRGLFTSLDPEPGGNENAYNYPNDPINAYDLDGHSWWRNAGRWAWKHKWGIALTVASFVPVVGGAVWAYRAYRIVRLAKAGRDSFRATRATSWLAGRMWVGRRGTMGRARNGARWYHKGSGSTHRSWRGAAKKGRHGWSSNLEKSVRGRHDYRNIHINHRSPKRWAPWW